MLSVIRHWGHHELWEQSKNYYLKTQDYTAKVNPYNIWKLRICSLNKPYQGQLITVFVTLKPDA